MNQTSMKNKKEKIIEICRSFSQKLNTGNYTTADFFASFKQEALESEAVEVSEKLLKFAQDEVEKSVNNFKLENTPLKELTQEEKQSAEWQGQNDSKEKNQAEKESWKISELEAVNLETL